jgi:hypothetical protein
MCLIFSKSVVSSRLIDWRHPATELQPSGVGEGG